MNPEARSRDAAASPSDVRSNPKKINGMEAGGGALFSAGPLRPTRLRCPDLMIGSKGTFDADALHLIMDHSSQTPDHASAATNVHCF